jgi:hypothetical protein
VNAKAVIWPGIISPLPSKALPSQLPKKASSSMRKQPLARKAISRDEETSVQGCSPVPKAMENKGCPVECSGDIQELPFERPETCQRFANEQSQTSHSPGEVGERRRTYIIEKINKMNDNGCSPEPYAALTLLDPLFTPTLCPCHSSIGSASRLKTELGNNNIVNGDEEVSVGKRSHEETIALMLGSRTSAGQIWTASPRCWKNKPKAITEKPPRQGSYNVVNEDKNGRSVKDSPEPLVALTLPINMPVLPIPTTPAHQPPEEPMLPVGTTPR